MNNSLNNPNQSNNPNKLTPVEMKNPFLVFSVFFDVYDLTDIRIYLRDRELEQDKPREHPSLSEHLEKLVEAAWLIHKESPIKNKEKK